ncbi:MAG: prolipoprotein diacylglyceryl transferase [Lachnospiraceae bacterium]|jgi:phosphatidylglycerol:prolipoprotein diacylglycerol transferase|nr:prolipoprotein diacylglyceryl transferase [Lachnospiraceae bacterium]
MHNELFSIGSVTVYSYGVMLAIGVIACFFMADRRAPKFGLDPDIIFNAGFISIIVGFISSKLLYIIVDIPNIIASSDPWRAILNSGFVVYGGLIGGVLTGLIYLRRKKVPFLPYFDLAAPSMVIAQAFGRIGCFLAGCCYGCRTETAIGVVFSGSRHAPNGVSIIPTQLISSFGNFIIMFILLWYANKRPKAGRVGALYIMLYSVGRFALEFFRDDNRGYWGAFSTSQWIAIALLPLGIWLFVSAKETVTATAAVTAAETVTDKVVKVPEKDETNTTNKTKKNKKAKATKEVKKPETDEDK